MSGVDSFAIELPPVPLQSFDADSGLMPLFDEPILGGFAVPSYAASSVDSIHSSPVGYSPTHAMPSPQTADGMPGMTESSSDELAHARSGIIDKLPTKKRMAHLEAEVKVEEDSAGSGPGGDGAEGPDDDRTMKRQRRLMKNRESAQLSRQRKKVYVEELEKKVAQLQRSNDDLAKKNAVLTKDNVALREEVVRLAQQLRGGQPRPLSASKSAKAAGVCLLVVLFSFGIIFNSSQRLPFEDSLGTARARHIGRTLAQVELKRTAKDNEEEMPAVSHPSVAHIEVKADDVRQAPADAKLRAPIKTNIASIGSIAERAAKLPDAKERRTVIGGEAKDRTSARLAVDSFDPTAFQELKRRKTAVKVFSDPHHVAIEDEDAPAVIQPVGDNHKSQLVPAKNSDLVPLSMEPYHVSLPMGAATRTRPVTQYFFCPEAQRLMPTNGDSHADMPPNYVALLIPGEMLNSTFAPANSLVEVTCSVASMNVYPNYLAPLPEHQDQAALQRVSDDSE